MNEDVLDDTTGMKQEVAPLSKKQKYSFLLVCSKGHTQVRKGVTESIASYIFLQSAYEVYTYTCTLGITATPSRKPKKMKQPNNGPSPMRSKTKYNLATNLSKLRLYSHHRCLNNLSKLRLYSHQMS